MVHLFRLRNSLHGRNKLGVFLQSFNSLSHPSLSGHSIQIWILFSPLSLSPQCPQSYKHCSESLRLRWDAMECCSDTSDDLCVMCNVGNVSPWCAVLDSISSPRSDQGTSSDPISTDTIPTEMRIEEEWRNTNISVWLKLQIVFLGFPRRKYFPVAKYKKS